MMRLSSLTYHKPIFWLKTTICKQGFISLDCGLLPEYSPYIEQITSLKFVSDDDFIKTGKSGRISSEWQHDYRQYNALRYFPDGSRHCYDLSVKQDINYLIRAGFAYGNYDGRNVYPKFDLYIGPNLWTSVQSDYLEVPEIIHKAKTNSLQICLVKTGTTTPFISSLELRPLNDAYSTHTQLGSLALITRSYNNEDRSLPTRYPDDVYDRLWDTYIYISGDEIGINTTLNVNTSNLFELPQVVGRSAVIPENVTESLDTFEFVDNPSDNIVVYLHFAEIQNLQANDTREFDIVWNDKITNSAYSPKKLQIETIFNTSPIKCDYQSCDLKLVRTNKSTLPPLLNAFEAYNILEFPDSETDSADVAAMKNIKAAYKLEILSWQGDPCLPPQWKWEGVGCNYTNKSTPPRIISLDLSSRKLHGIIVPAFQNLTHLQKLDLSNNGLSGSVPEFLATMNSLSIINLSRNKLKGRVPKALRDRKKTTGLQLLIEGNPNLCLDDLCKIKHKSILIPVLSSIAAGLVVIVVMVVLFFGVQKEKKFESSKSPNNKVVNFNEEKKVYISRS